MNNASLLLGGNLGDINLNFKTAIDSISKNIGPISKQSSLYQSEAWGFDSNSLFLNQVIEVETKLSAFEILNITQSIEKKIGRKSKTKDQEYSSRLIDIDILFFNDEIIETDKLTIPHPRLHLRNFTLFPLAEIAANYIHPKLNQSVNWLLKHSEDNSNCKKV